MIPYEHHAIVVSVGQEICGGWTLCISDFTINGDGGEDGGSGGGIGSVGVGSVSGIGSGKHNHCCCRCCSPSTFSTAADAVLISSSGGTIVTTAASPKTKGRCPTCRGDVMDWMPTRSYDTQVWSFALQGCSERSNAEYYIERQAQAGEPPPTDE